MSSIFLPPLQRQEAPSHHPPAPPRKTVGRPAKVKLMTAELPVTSVPEIEAPKVVQAAAGIDPVLRLPKVCDLTGCAKSTWLRYVKDGIAPRGIRLGPNTVGWFQSSIVAWLQSRPQA